MAVEGMRVAGDPVPPTMAEAAPVVPKRRPRHSRDDIRSLLLEAAQAILREEGLGVGTDTLTFKRVYARVEQNTGLRLTNASVIRRVWENLADYRTDVLLGIAADENHVEMDETFEALALAPTLERLDLSTLEQRSSALTELCRVAGNANILSIGDSENWSLWFGVWSQATAGEITEQKQRLQSALLKGYESVTDMYTDTFQALADLIGYRLRPGLTMRQFTVSVGALAEGCSLRNRVEGDTDGILLSTGPDGEVQEWSLFAVGAEALARRFFEPDPDWPPPAA
jgi:hypothetical protein